MRSPSPAAEFAEQVFVRCPMAVAGLPTASRRHAIDASLAALEMQATVARMKALRPLTPTSGRPNSEPPSKKVHRHVKSKARRAA